MVVQVILIVSEYAHAVGPVTLTVVIAEKSKSAARVVDTVPNTTHKGLCPSTNKAAVSPTNNFFHTLFMDRWCQI